jgi:hypothetical protein
MSVIENPERLERGKPFWIKYTNREAVLGPYRVKTVYRGHEGTVVVGTNVESRQDASFVLADDDEYGQPIFHDCKPET